jgi:hypothetical protein
MMVPAQLGQKVSETPSKTNELGVMVLTCYKHEDHIQTEPGKT